VDVAVAVLLAAMDSSLVDAATPVRAGGLAGRSEGCTPALLVLEAAADAALARSGRPISVMLAAGRGGAAAPTSSVVSAEEQGGC